MKDVKELARQELAEIRKRKAAHHERKLEMATPEARQRAAEKRELGNQIDRNRYLNNRKMRRTEVGLPYTEYVVIRKAKAEKTLTHKIGPKWRNT